MVARKNPWLIGVLLLGFALATRGDGGPASQPEPIDYSQAHRWLSLPVATRPVDVFYLYPTAWRKTASDGRICSIDNATMLKGAPAAFARQATAFESVGNLFAPYYRQVDLSPVDREKLIGTIPTSDAVAAFDYYLKHKSGGRPFILAAHSQGSDVLSNILSGYMKDNPRAYRRMVAAYVIGYSVTDRYLARNPHLKFAEGPDDTGVIISYNTQAPGVAPGANPVVSPGGLVINPISWTRDERLATASEGLGSFMPDPVTGVLTHVAQVADARIDKARGVLICSTADKGKLYKLSGGMGEGVYHSFDYPFYYENLRANAARRVAKFLGKR